MEGEDFENNAEGKIELLKTVQSRQPDPQPNVTKLLQCLHAPFWDELIPAKNILVSGCGGGYDFFSGLPILLALKDAGFNVYFGNLTFTIPDGIVPKSGYSPCCIRVTADSKRNVNQWPQGEYYWPEYFVSKWFREKRKEEVPVFMFERTGVEPLRKSYQSLVDDLKIDTIILVDGGSDSLMTGDESGLGTPSEDMMSIGAVYGLQNVPRKFLLCLGMGIDTYHGVCHYHFLENVAALAKTNDYLGCFSLIQQQAEAQAFKEAYISSQPGNSIVCSSLLSAIEGHSGNYHSPYTKQRTQGELFISPLMNLFWCFKLDGVAKRVKYLPLLEKTVSMSDISLIIMQYRNKNVTNRRKERNIPY
jgi:hypothetical protein